MPKEKKENRPVSKKYSKYKIDGDTVIRDKYCPRCGPGIFLMKTSTRNYCGRCHYTEFLKSA
jgi:small subunit ribosomal protein S27Ae